MSVFTFCLLHVIILLTCISLQVRLSSTANILGDETDRLALLAFKSKITQDPLQILSSWNASRHFCEWDGVACGRRHQRVTILRLPSQGLVGTISPHIGNLSFLRMFVLQNNYFHGEIPQELGRLFRLEDLILRNNSLVGNIPVNISMCLNLKNLFLERNNLVGNIPMALGSLPMLVELVLHINQLSGVIPPSLGNISSLEVISLSQNNLSGSIPRTLDQLKSLQVFGISLNKLSGEFPHSLYNLSALYAFAIDGNNLSGNLPTDIGLSFPNLQQFLIGIWDKPILRNIPGSLFNITGIQRIDIGENQFTGEVPPVGILKDLEILAMDGNALGSGKSGDLGFIASLTNCHNLRVLAIGFNQFGGKLPSSIANFSNHLSSLSLGGNRISGNILSEFGSLQSLINLDLHANSFTGSIPTAIGNLKNLGILSMYGNQLSGQIPSSFRNMSRLFSLDLSYNILEGGIASILDNSNLQTLDLSYNKFTGVISNQKLGLSLSLIELKLAHNSLNGLIPSQVGDLKHLETLDVSENKLSGEIPPTLGNCLNLEHLYIQRNFFHGSIPSSFSSLKSLQDLDVSSNNITGEIPKELEKLSFLKYLNFSFNDLEGEVPMKGIFGNTSAFSIVGNSNICGGISELKLPKCRITKSKKRGNHLALKVTFGVLLPSLMMALLVVVYLSQKRAKPKSSFHHYQGGLPRVSYNELHKATNGFSLANLIGMGSYGSVYKGVLQQDEGPIAVKVLNLKERGASKTFLAECEALRAVRHRNLLKILTVCSSVDFTGKDFKALLIEFMPNGSLESWLHPSSNGQRVCRSLSLHERVNIAIDIAYALNYLHNDCERPLVHCDLKSSNVLLSDDMSAHVGDFGLAKFLVKTTSNSNQNETSTIAIRGTIGYIPPEYGMGEEVSKQGDIYSYGILLLEMFTGKRPTDQMFKDGLSLHDFSKRALPEKVMEIIDMGLPSEQIHKESVNLTNFMKECLTSIITIGVACSMEQMKERMDIKDVLKELHSIKETLRQV